MNNYTDKEFHTLSMAVTKALCPMEAPLKIKHVRSAIIVTFRTRESKTFWLLCTRQPLMEYRFTAWKFCHLLHKMLREAHESVLRTSLPHRKMLIEMGKLWGHLQDGVGHCIKAYSQLLVTKISFHEKNPIFPGSLLIPNFETIEKYAQHDVNVHYELCIEIFDYLDDILSLQTTIFNSVNTYRMTSMTPAGQCRLAPIIVLIQDSNPLYDICVRLMFRLHEALPNDILAGHRERFKEQFRKLKTFYDNVRPLQYFADLIQVPHLPESAPNFSSKVDFGNYVAPVVHVPEEPEHLQTVNDLVDTSLQQHELEQLQDNQQLEQPGSSSSAAAEQKSIELINLEENLRDRDQRIFELQSDLLAIQDNVHILENQYKSKISELRSENVNLSNDLTTIQEQLANMRLAKNELELKLSQTPTLLQKASEGEEKAKQSEEKFNKLKTLYGTIRDEHIQLLRQHGEASKLLTKEQNAKQELQQRFEEAETKLNDLTEKCALVEAQTEQMKCLDLQRLNFEIENENLKKLIEELQKNQNSEVQDLQKELQNLKLVNKDLISIKEEKELLERHLSETQMSLDRSASQHEEKASSLETQLLEKTKDLLTVKHELNETKTLLKEKENDYLLSTEQAEKEKQSFESLLKEKQNLLDQKDLEISQLKETHQNEYTSIQKDLEKSQNDLLQNQIKLETKQNEFEKLKISDSFALQESEKLFKETSLKLEDSLKAFQMEKEKCSSLQTKHLQMEKSFEFLNQEKLHLQDNLEKLNKDSQEALEKSQKDLKNLERSMEHLLQSLINKAENIYSQKSKMEVKAFPQALTIAKDLESSLDKLQELYLSLNNNQMDSSSLALSIMTIAQQFTVLDEEAGCIAHTASDIEKSEQLLTNLQHLGKLLQALHQNLNPLDSLKSNSYLNSSLKEIKLTLNTINEMVLLLFQTLNKQMDIGDLVQKELNDMDKAIEEAVSRFVDLLSATRNQDQGIQLEVNEKILDACTQLMECIKQLIKRSKILQEEIVSTGRGKSSVKEFYKRNSNWTEGLISASKSVAKCANLLVDAANKSVSSIEPHEHFEIIVAAQEIAACTAQLVIASKVKAPKNSLKLSDLTQASREVSKATGAVVATVKSCTQDLEIAQEIDITKLTASQLKAMEMEIHVKILELEQALEMERRKLSSFRRKNYQSTED